MSVANGDILKVVVEAVLDDGTIAQNVIHCQANIVGVPYADATILAHIKSALEAAYTNIISYIDNAVTFNPVTVDIVEWDGVKWEVTYHVGTTDLDLTPTSALDPFPNQVAPFCVMNTVRPKSKGRKFLFGFTEDTASGSHLGGAVVTAIADFAADLIANWALDALDYLTPGIVRKAVGTFLVFLSAVVTNVVGTQRRRRPGVGM